MSTHFVIIGNGAAGYRAAKAIRRADGDARISVFSEERHPFYLRRQLGDFLAGHLTLDELIFQSRNAYRRERIDLFLMTRVTHLDPSAHEATFASGQQIRYDRLLVATGTRAAPPAIPGISLDGVASLDTLTAAQEVQRFLSAARQAAILGEGVLGLALAESLTKRGLRVTQVIRRERFWPELLDETTGGLVESVLEANGVVLRRNAEPQAIIGSGNRAIGVETTGGEAFPADLIVCGCRRRPNIDLVKGSGLEVGRGLRVNASLGTRHPDIFAAGDVAELAESDEGQDESAPFCWQRAWAQGGLAAASMLGRPAEAAAEAIRVRTAVFGHDLAVIGRGNLQEKQAADIEVVERRGQPGVYRRLVFDKGLLVGAIVFGTGESVHELNQLVAEKAPRAAVNDAIAVDVPAPAEGFLPQTFAQHCPICASELSIHQGARVGSAICCAACNTDLVVRWDGRRGWLEIPNH
jgi:nitrite reductase (NADH) large subunit